MSVLRRIGDVANLVADGVLAVRDAFRTRTGHRADLDARAARVASLEAREEALLQRQARRAAADAAPGEEEE